MTTGMNIVSGTLKIKEIHGHEFIKGISPFPSISIYVW